ncbi:MAG: hypothetical protein M1826_006172 [Phylliscum demangeonii]|nr:MAG: hypothetical protein M1826_006172 [Phylliscum demangeonii]
MASAKDARASANHVRAQSSSGPGPMPVRSWHARHASHHALSVPAMSQTHRVARRKSMSSTAASQLAVVAAAVREAPAMPDGAVIEGDRDASGDVAHSVPSRLDRTREDAGHGDAWRRRTSVIADAFTTPSALPIAARPGAKARLRRASDGSQRLKGGAGGDLKCQTCGKRYKHSSCLTKHLWEHTPEWSYTSKLLVSKHQQVQLLEAASVLIAMNQHDPPGPDPDPAMLSDQSSTSPAASPSSGRLGAISSADTTPPPRADDAGNEARCHPSVGWWPDDRHPAGVSRGRPASVQAGAMMMDGDEDEEGLAAAVGLLSCSMGTPQWGPTPAWDDIPPVPPLPAHFLAGERGHGKGPDRSAARPWSDRRPSAVRAAESEESAVEDDSVYDPRLVPHNRGGEDEDEGVFGRMEE